jgi:hypothetical protein
MVGQYLRMLIENRNMTEIVDYSRIDSSPLISALSLRLCEPDVQKYL